MLTEFQINENKTRFISILRSSNKENIDSLISWLEKTDFFYAPSSANYHCNYSGGLCEHSLNVYEVAMKLKEHIIPMSNKKNADFTDSELIISCLLHDLCKISFYVPEVKWTKDSNNQWKQYQGWKINDVFPLGHGEKSVIMAQNLIRLTTNEIMAIRWHMGPYSKATSLDDYEKPAFAKAVEDYPIVMVVSQADAFSSLMIEETVDTKTLE